MFTIPRSEDADSRLMEYMAKMTLITISLIAIPFSLISVIAWFYGIIPADTVIILFCMSILFMTGWWLANIGFWRISSLIPSLIILLAAIYGNFIGGTDVPAMLLYVLAILMMAVLRGVRGMYVVLTVSLISYFSIGEAYYLGYLKPLRTSETAFMNRMIITIASILSISLLVRFLILQYRRAIDLTRQEVNERKAVEEELRNSEKNYRELVQSANSIIMRMNTEGEITFINEFAERFFGYKFDEIRGKNVVGTIVPESDSSGSNLGVMIKNILKNPDDFRFNENENMTRDGKRVWITWANKSIRGKDGRLVEILCVGNDVTERKQALEENERIQMQLIQSQKMEAIGTLTSGIAHDFNNMLGAIMGSISLLDIILKNETITERVKTDSYIQIAVDSSKRASDTIRKLLLLSRRQEIKLMPVDINISMGNVIDICRNSFPKSVSLNVLYGPGPMMVMADSALIEQIFLNFCVNASHAMTIMREPGEKEGGNLLIHISQVESLKPGFLNSEDGIEQERYIRIEFTDTGVGMDEVTQNRIFEPFFTLKKRESGTGLGLSMAYNLIQHLGGFIELESEINKGSCFRIYLPELSQNINDIVASGSDKQLVKGNKTILVIDDEVFIQSVAQNILSFCGYNVLKASNGLEGISIYEKNIDRIGAILLDVSMPGMSGFEVFDELKKINSAVKVLFSSGYSEDERVSEAISRGASGFIQKPYTAVELSRSINEILNG